MDQVIGAGEWFTLLIPLSLDLSTRVVYEATITYHEGKDINSLTFCIFWVDVLKEGKHIPIKPRVHLGGD